VNGLYTLETVITGICWPGPERAPDALILVGLIGMTPADYLSQTELRYLMIPAMVIATGVLADKAGIKKNPV
jgi:hypothetical protein